jgi:hypothetical protein
MFLFYHRESLHPPLGCSSPLLIPIHCFPSFAFPNDSHVPFPCNWTVYQSQRGNYRPTSVLYASQPVMRWPEVSPPPGPLLNRDRRPAHISRQVWAVTGQSFRASRPKSVPVSESPVLFVLSPSSRMGRNESNKSQRG